MFLLMSENLLGIVSLVGSIDKFFTLFIILLGWKEERHVLLNYNPKWVHLQS